MSEPKTLYLVGEADRGKRLDLFLRERIPKLSRARLQEAIKTRITLSWGVESKPSTPVRPGGEVIVGFTPVAEGPLDIEIPVLGRGERWIAVDKPAGMMVHPVNTVRENSLIRVLRRREENAELRLVHRLDRETSGVLLVAEGSEAARRFSTAFEKGLVEKEYLALVRGVVRADEGTVDLPIGKAGGSRVYVRREAAAEGEPAVTAWKVEERLSDRTLLRVFPRTGRRHQIRVHLSAIGHPILGDILYGREDRDYLDLVEGRRDARREEGGPRRQLLHSTRLVFPDPGTGRPVQVTSPPPPDFVEGIEFGRRRGGEGFRATVV